MLLLGSYEYYMGSYVNVVDTYLDLKKFGFNFDFKSHNILNDPKAPLTIYKNIGNIDIMNSLTNETSYDDDLVIINFSFVYRIFQYNLPIKLKCKTLIVFDETHQWRAYQEGILDKCNDWLKNSADEVIFLCNPETDKYCFDNIVRYYHKMSTDRLEFLKPQFNNGKTLVRIPELHDKNTVLYGYFDDWHKKLTHKNIFECDKYIYTRSSKYNNKYYELFGMITFEFLYYGRKVGYKPLNKTNEDGFVHYFNLFGYDDEKEYEILDISKEEIEEKLIMNENDKLLELINDRI